MQTLLQANGADAEAPQTLGELLRRCLRLLARPADAVSLLVQPLAWASPPGGNPAGPWFPGSEALEAAGAGPLGAASGRPAERASVPGCKLEVGDAGAALAGGRPGVAETPPKPKRRGRPPGSRNSMHSGYVPRKRARLGNEDPATPSGPRSAPGEGAGQREPRAAASAPAAAGAPSATPPAKRRGRPPGRKSLQKAAQARAALERAGAPAEAAPQAREPAAGRSSVDGAPSAADDVPGAARGGGEPHPGGRRMAARARAGQQAVAAAPGMKAEGDAAPAAPAAPAEAPVGDGGLGGGGGAAGARVAVGFDAAADAAAAARLGPRLRRRLPALEGRWWAKRWSGQRSQKAMHALLACLAVRHLQRMRHKLSLWKCCIQAVVKEVNFVDLLKIRVSSSD